MGQEKPKKRGKGCLWWGAAAVLAIFGLAVLGMVMEALGITPSAAERTATVMAQSSTEQAASNLTATIVALTPPT